MNVSKSKTRGVYMPGSPSIRGAAALNNNISAGKCRLGAKQALPVMARFGIALLGIGFPGNFTGFLNVFGMSGKEFQENHAPGQRAA